MIVSMMLMALLALAGLAITLTVWAFRQRRERPGRGRADLMIHALVGVGSGTLLGLLVVIGFVIHGVMAWRNG